ncbi:unnamed protein product [Heligmosomoides polygyrus]|uniref:Uncharacterized protein n=1 Tax=Heligmosomoides polygyrus TaxID=6339 RepID=A0A183FEM0_HELPZ|nr:unnamed protein product [Heligmosomoides polygyrus]
MVGDVVLKVHADLWTSIGDDEDEKVRRRPMELPEPAKWRCWFSMISRTAAARGGSAIFMLLLLTDRRRRRPMCSSSPFLLSAAGPGDYNMGRLSGFIARPLLRHAVVLRRLAGPRRHTADNVLAPCGVSQLAPRRYPSLPQRFRFENARRLVVVAVTSRLLTRVRTVAPS